MATGGDRAKRKNLSSATRKLDAAKEALKKAKNTGEYKSARKGRRATKGGKAKSPNKGKYKTPTDAYKRADYEAAEFSNKLRRMAGVDEIPSRFDSEFKTKEMKAAAKKKPPKKAPPKKGTGVISAPKRPKRPVTASDKAEENVKDKARQLAKVRMRQAFQRREMPEGARLYNLNEMREEPVPNPAFPGEYLGGEPIPAPRPMDSAPGGDGHGRPLKSGLIYRKEDKRPSFERVTGRSELDPRGGMNHLEAWQENNRRRGVAIDAAIQEQKEMSDTFRDDTEGWSLDESPRPLKVDRTIPEPVYQDPVPNPFRVPVSEHKYSKALSYNHDPSRDGRYRWDLNKFHRRNKAREAETRPGYMAIPWRQRTFFGEQGYDAGMGNRVLSDELRPQWSSNTGVAEPDRPQAEMSDTFRNTPGSQYRYKAGSPGAAKEGDGEQYGVMAQDLEKTPAGKTAVNTKPDGRKTVDTRKLTMLNSGALNEVLARLDKLEKRRK